MEKNIEEKKIGDVMFVHKQRVNTLANYVGNVIVEHSAEVVEFSQRTASTLHCNCCLKVGA